MRKKFVPKFRIHDKECRAYNENTEIQKKVIGSTIEGPITIEEEIVVDTYCSIHGKYDFDCTECPIYKAKMREVNQNE